ncbi:MAG: DEAD/DEAH box helicase, partial [Rhodospirillales bacterium]|nr:DEAD/DEAH box helicase [Rhodospirillales bacterium]
MGKTYAVFGGPLLEYVQTHGEKQAKTKQIAPHTVLWVTPLRALAHDTQASLLEPVEAIGLPWSVELRTGDTSSSAKARQRKRLPTVLITTPESLSILLSYADARQCFATLQCVIVDEWHELLSTKRGVQAELALARLRQWNPQLRAWGLSATLGNLEEARDCLLGCADDKVSPGKLIHGKLPKAVEVQTLMPRTIERFPWAGHMGVKLLQQVIETIEEAKTSLLFTNTRSQAELWYQKIILKRPDLIGAVAIHHGSLDRAVRNEVEDLIRAGRLKAVVCTSSLDLGVDFSPVDQVLQLGSPKGVARLMQRAGRSGHQPGAISRVLGVPTHAFELIEFSAAREAIDQRRIEARPPLRKPLDVLAQHVITLACGEGFVPRELFDEVRTTHAYRDLTGQEWRWTLAFAEHGGETLRAYPQYARICLCDGRYTASSAPHAKQHRMTIGTITSDTAMLIKFRNGKTLGSIEESFVARLKPGDRFLFSGR